MRRGFGLAADIQYDGPTLPGPIGRGLRRRCEPFRRPGPCADSSARERRLAGTRCADDAQRASRLNGKRKAGLGRLAFAGRKDCHALDAQFAFRCRHRHDRSSFGDLCQGVQQIAFEIPSVSSCSILLGPLQTRVRSMLDGTSDARERPRLSMRSIPAEGRRVDMPIEQARLDSTRVRLGPIGRNRRLDRL